MAESEVTGRVPIPASGEDEFDTIDLDTEDTRKSIGLGISLPISKLPIEDPIKETDNHEPGEKPIEEAIEENFDPLDDIPPHHPEAQLEQISELDSKRREEETQVDNGTEGKEDSNPNQDLDAITVLPPGITLLNADPHDDDIKEFPSMPVTPMSPTFGRKTRHTKLAPSLALSISSPNFSSSNQGQAVSAIVLITTALEAIGKHKAVIRNSTIKASVTKALSKYFCFAIHLLLN
jgi:hypothetical protein